MSFRGGGIPRRRMTQLKGPESACKTTTLLRAVASVQREGGVAAWVQGEEFDKTWCTTNGANASEVCIIPAAENGDEALERASVMLETGTIDLLVIDSVQSIGTTRELEETDVGDAGYGSGSPQMWGQFTRRVARAFGKGADTAVVWTSQMRAKIGGFMPPGADRDDGTQIKALLHAKSVDIRFDKKELLRNENKDVIGRQYALRCDKNKTATPHRSGEFRFYLPNAPTPGFDRAFDARVWGVEAGVISRAGAWYTVDGKRAQGEEGLINLLRSDPEVLAEVEEAVMDFYAGGGA